MQEGQNGANSFGNQRGFRGRGGFIGGRARGFARGGGVAPSTGGTPAHAASQDPSSQRVWFAMKPEKVWTKHTDTFLYFDSVLRARPGQGAGLRVKLPGATGQVVRSRRYSQAASSSHIAPVSASTTVAHEEPDRQFIVHIPRATAAKEEVLPEPHQDP